MEDHGLPSHRQYLAMSLIPPDGIGGPELREAMRKQRLRGTGRAAFYEMMKRLRDAGWVEAEEEVIKLDGEGFKQNRYRLSASGERAMVSFELAIADARERRSAAGWSTVGTGS